MEIWEEHDTLYHYTTQAGLQGILESQTIHATHYKYLNDTTELFHMKDKLPEFILPSVTEFIRGLMNSNAKLQKQIDSDGGIDKIAKHDAQTMVESLFVATFSVNKKFRFFDPFIASFCGHNERYEKTNGLLSQWRAYGTDSGYAILFDAKQLSDLLKDQESANFCYASGDIGTVVYEDDDEKFTNEFGKLIDAIKQSIPKLHGNDIPDLKDLYTSFLASVPRYKHCGFKEEQETRIVFSPMSEDSVEYLKLDQPNDYERLKAKEVKLVHFKDGLVPYIKLLEQTANKPKAQLPIKHIIVGPHRDKQVRADRVAKYLELRGIEATVSCSATPLVGR